MSKLTAAAFLADDFNRDAWDEDEFQHFINRNACIVEEITGCEMPESDEVEMYVCDWACTASDDEKAEFIKKIDG